MDYNLNGSLSVDGEGDKKYTPLQLILKIEEKISGYGKMKGICYDRQKH